MLPKVITFDEHFEATGEPRCQIIDVRDRRLYKYASSDALDYASTVMSEPGFTNVLVLAMSASEYYGPNRNGDAFAEKPVKVNGQWAVAPGETLPEHHQSFERRAHDYRHHINKDPAKSLGGVRKSFYNHKMHRVELFLRVSHSAGSDIVDRIDGGEFPAVSMGCRIKYEVCSHCGNRAPTRAQYCEHVNNTNPKYGMNRLMPDGERMFVWNPAPDLFDISFVFKPADKIGFMMKKVAFDRAPYELKTSADMGAEEQDISEKRSALQKVSDIEKVVAGDVGDARDTPSLDNSEVNAVSHTSRILSPWMRGIPTVSSRDLLSVGGCSMPQLASSMFAVGMMPTVVELFRLICALKGIESDPDVEMRLSFSQGKIASALSRAPQVLSACEQAGLIKLSGAYVRRDIVDLVTPMQEKRALYKDYLARRYVPESVGGLVEQSGVANILPGENMSTDNAYYKSTHQPLHWKDEASGKTYQTTRRAGEKADWSNRKKELAEAAGIAGVSAVGYKAIAGRHPIAAAPLLLGGGWLATDTIKNQQTPTVKTLEGVDVPVNTEFVEKRASGLMRVGVPIAGGALTTALITQDMVGAPPEIVQMYRDNPSGGWLANTALLAGLTAIRPSAIASAVRENMPDVSNVVSKFANASIEDVNLEDAFRSVGEALMR